jgi:hypothetical protein
LITEQRLLKKLNTTKYSISVVEEIHHWDQKIHVQCVALIHAFILVTEQNEDC